MSAENKALVRRYVEEVLRTETAISYLRDASGAPA
jgi:hypothetical protein